MRFSFTTLKKGIGAALLGATLMASGPASAAFTIFGANVFDEAGVTNSGLATGVADGAAAVVAQGGSLTLGFNNPLTGTDVMFTLLPGSGMNFLTISVGEVVGGVATFSAGSLPFFDTGAGGVFTVDLAPLCATVSAAGCSLVRFTNVAAIGSPGFALDGVSGVTNAPEPKTWALMILGFCGVAWRMKRTRKTILRRLDTIHASTPPSMALASPTP